MGSDRMVGVVVVGGVVVVVVVVVVGVVVVVVVVMVVGVGVGVVVGVVIVVVVGVFGVVVVIEVNTVVMVGVSDGVDDVGDARGIAFGGMVVNGRAVAMVDSWVNSVVSGEGLNVGGWALMAMLKCMCVMAGLIFGGAN